MPKDKESSGDAVAKVIALIEAFEPPDRARILRTVATYFGSPPDVDRSFPPPDLVPETTRTPPFSTDKSVTPKQFISDKKPITDVERVACLAYYLTHHRDVSQFKTADISKLNTEAAQVRFSNPAMAVGNAMRKGFVAHANKDYKQLSALGEQYVQALPDREAAKAVFAEGPAARRRSRGRSAIRSRTN